MNLKRATKKFLALFLASLNVLPLFNPISHAYVQKSTTQVIKNAKSADLQYGFNLKKSFLVGEHKILEFKHEKSGMWLVVEENNNIDKKFEIMVRTPPENDKGINHIIEHCILNGSNEYPCKNMIWELNQISYNTFLNAFTCPCYTSFPVASTDEDELFSLAKIYTSGIFHPAFLKDKRIFKKEGIRFELDSENKLVANGTVFNEMQGNNPDMLNSILKTIFPDTQSKNVSGGIPEKIIDLSYDEICKTYEKYYHPSNMVAYMSGSIDYKKFMKFLDEEYLKNYNKIDLQNIKYVSQDTSKLPSEKTVYYYKQATDKNIFSSNLVSLIDYSSYINNEYNLDVLTQIINNTNSERTLFLKDKGYLGIASAIFDHFYDPAIMVSLSSEKEELVSPENTQKTLKELFEKYPIEKSEIESVVGIENFDKKLGKKTDLYDSALNSEHFIKSFIKFNDPCSDKYFVTESKSFFSSLLSKFKKQSDKKIPNENNLNNLIGNVLNKWHKTIIVSKPSSDKSLSSKERLKAKVDSLQDKKDILTKNYQRQKDWAEAPNSEENRTKLKKMFKKLSQIDTPKLDCKLKTNKVKNINCYHSIQDIGEFISYKLIFNLNNLTDEELKYMEFFSNALNNNNTQKYSREKLNKLKSNICQISSKTDIFPTNNNCQNASMVINITSGKDDCDKTIQLAMDQFLNVDFKDTDSLKKFLELTTISYESTPKSTLKFYDILAREISPIYNYLNSGRKWEETMNLYKETQSKLSDDKFINEFAEKLTSLKNKIFSTCALQGIGICSSEENKKLSEEKLKTLLEHLDATNYKQFSEIKLIPSKKQNIACIDPSTSNNNVICVIDSKELCNSEDFDVTCRIINDRLLAPNIREKNGAYGASISRVPDTGKIIINSYCDPHIKSSIDIFKSIPKFIKTLNIENSEIESISKSLLGNTFSKNKLDIFSHQVEKRICSNLDYCEKINSSIDSIKNVTIDRIKKHGEILEKAMSNMKIYVVSSDRKNIEEKMFDDIFE